MYQATNSTAKNGRKNYKNTFFHNLVQNTFNFFESVKVANTKKNKKILKNNDFKEKSYYFRTRKWH